MSDVRLVWNTQFGEFVEKGLEKGVVLFDCLLCGEKWDHLVKVSESGVDDTSV